MMQNSLRHVPASICLSTAIAIAALWFPVALSAAPERIYRIGYMLPPSETAVRSHTEGFLTGLRELGYVVGKNLRIDYRFADYELSRLPQLARELVELEPDVIVTASPPGVRAAQQATNEIPIVIAAVYDPVGLGFVKSLAHPGGNITGLSVQYEDTIPKLLELIAATVPKVGRVAVLQTADPSHDKFVARIAAMARSRKLAVEAFSAAQPSDIAPAFERIGASASDAVFVLPHPLFNTRPDVVVDAALREKLPGIYPFSTYADAGGLMSLGVDLPEIFRRAAHYVDRILKGQNPATLPVEQPMMIDLVVNLKTAKKLEITVPQSVMLRANRVIE